jgi:hypothetical protein
MNNEIRNMAFSGNDKAERRALARVRSRGLIAAVSPNSVDALTGCRRNEAHADK